MATPPPPPAALPPTCEVWEWPVFIDGYHKAKLYPDAALDQLAANFRLLSAASAPVRAEDGEPYLVPVVKLGHDDDQRAAVSAGWPNVGRVVGLTRGAETGSVRLWLAGVPTTIGGLMNAGYYRSGSIEIDELPDPRDPSKKLPGPVLLGVALLGEEPPAVPGMGRPRAVFADGRPVPPNHDVAAVLGAMAAAPAPPPAQFARRRAFGRRPTRVLFSSEVRPMPTRDEMNAKLQAMGLDPAKYAGVPDADLAALLGGGQTMTDPPPPPPADPNGGYMSAFKKFSDDPGTPEATKALMTAFAKFADDCTKRFGATEAAVSDLQKLKPDAQMAAKFAKGWQEQRDADHKAAVTRDVEQAVREGRLEPRDKDDKITAGLSKSTVTKFSAGANAGLSEYEAWRKELFSRQPSPFFKEVVEEGDPADPAQDSFVQKAAKHLPGFREPAYRPASEAAAAAK